MDDSDMNDSKTDVDIKTTLDLLEVFRQFMAEHQAACVEAELTGVPFIFDLDHYLAAKEAFEAAYWTRGRGMGGK